MPTNRVEELEATVAELESTVRGLTEELVETKERVRILEAELDADPQTAVEDADPNVELAQGESSAQTTARGDIPESEATDTEIVTPEAGQDDVAEATKEATQDVVEGDKSGESEAADDSEDSDLGDDIIVA
ncbi:hypothetical protein G9C85_11700 [Halorubellus sp. JP-L1]|uniref:DUF7518 family protein n=1 Tax=Halorubellus sp. JP-L1 TaxID=2715753 RepID=UPI00140E76DF|nr:hypothetical protein [Halorubellus sp. JP-L1]NHN42285.1 hypothetical protein [Halorubellus sp. JP-L1]